MVNSHIYQRPIIDRARVHLTRSNNNNGNSQLKCKRSQITASIYIITDPISSIISEINGLKKALINKQLVKIAFKSKKSIG